MHQANTDYTTSNQAFAPCAAEGKPACAPALRVLMAPLDRLAMP